MEGKTQWVILWVFLRKKSAEQRALILLSILSRWDLGRRIFGFEITRVPKIEGIFVLSERKQKPSGGVLWVFLWKKSAENGTFRLLGLLCCGNSGFFSASSGFVSVKGDGRKEQNKLGKRKSQ